MHADSYTTLDSTNVWQTIHAETKNGITDKYRGIHAFVVILTR